MSSSHQFRGELGFLNEYTTVSEERYRDSRFLISPFESNLFQFKFGETVIEVNFDVRLEDGALLTAPQHQPLCNVFKSWLCVHESFDVTQGRVPATEPSKYKVQRTLHLIDYFLLNAERFQLAKHGLLTVTTNDMRGLLLDLAGASRAYVSLYRWPARLREYLLCRAKELTAFDITSALQDQPDLGDPYEGDDALLDLDAIGILHARVWLWKSGFYRRGGIRSHEYAPNLSLISDVVYRNTLYGRVKLLVAPELFITPRERNDRERDRAPVYDYDRSQAATRHFGRYLRTLRGLEHLYLAGMAVPLTALDALSDNVAQQCVGLRKEGRHRTLPQQMVLDALRNSLEFTLEHGDDLVDGYLRIINAWRKTDLTFMEFVDSSEFYAATTDKLKEMGVKSWAIKPLPTVGAFGMVHMAKTEFFSKFRRNEGLFELLRVFYGCVYVAVGALMARRSGELDELIGSTCLDKTGAYLIFANRKSGEVGMREVESRPIPPVAARMIRMITRIQSELVRLNIQPADRLLFAGPTRMYGIPWPDGYETDTSVSLDLFCDYFEMPVDSKGRRYYLRQHQLRRFFAILFFWGGAFGGLDTLRWFLGHTDVEHIWNYITESIPGEALQNVKIGFATEQILSGSPAADDLSTYLKEQYGIADFSVLDVDELNQYIALLMNEGQVEIEPHFLHLTGGESYRIHIIVKPLQGTIT